MVQHSNGQPVSYNFRRVRPKRPVASASRHPQSPIGGCLRTDFLATEICLGQMISIATVQAGVLGQPEASKTAIGSR
jgi:hypothetical protein